MGKTPLLPQPDRFNILIIVDSYGWAWDIASRQMLSHLPEGYSGAIINYWDLFNNVLVTPADWDVVLVYTYRNDMVLAHMSPHNTIICIESDPSTVEMYLKPLYDRFRHLAGMNGKVAYHLMNMYPDGGPRIHILSHGVDTDRFHPPEHAPERFTVGWVGRADRPSKRFNLADTAMKSVNAEWKPLKGLKDEGYVPPEMMPAYYRSLSALLVTSLVEVRPLVVMEALASGVVPVTTRVGDVEEYIQHNVNGLYLPYDLDAYTIATVVTRLRGMRGYNRMRLNARRTAESKLSWGKLIPSWVKVFEEVAAGE